MLLYFVIICVNFFENALPLSFTDLTKIRLSIPFCMKRLVKQRDWTCAFPAFVNPKYLMKIRIVKGVSFIE